MAITTIRKYPKCPVMKKNCFPSEAAGKAEAILNKWEEPYRFYECEHCGKFHVTSKQFDSTKHIFTTLLELVHKNQAEFLYDDGERLKVYKAKYGNSMYEFSRHLTTNYITIIRKIKVT